MQRMLKAVLSLVLAALLAAPCVAQTVVHRTDVVKGEKPYNVTGVITKQGWEFWAFGYTTPDALDLEFGHLYVVGEDWLLGGYLVWWPEQNKYFLLPWVTFQHQLAGGTVKLEVACYLPGNGGPTIFLVNELSWMTPIGDGFSAGPVAITTHPERTKWSVPVGLGVRYQKGATSVKFNWQPITLGEKGPHQMRLEISQGF